MKSRNLTIGITNVSEIPGKYLFNRIKDLGLNVVDLTKIDKLEINDELKVIYCFPSYSKFMNQYLKLYKNLNWVKCSFAGVDQFVQHKDIFKEKQIQFTNMKGVFSPSLGEFTLAAILYWEKRMDLFSKSKLEKSFEKFPVNMLNEHTIGIVGYGNIGVEVAKRAKLGFGMNVIGLKTNLENIEGKEYCDKIVDNSQIEYLLNNSDYVINILPKTKLTDDYFDDNKFKMMKKDSIFINIGRGSSVNEDDLIKHLKIKTNIKAATLDVTKIEPLPKESELWNLDNCFISNHSADKLNDNMDNEKLSIDFFIKILNEEYLKNGIVKTNLVDLYKEY